MDYELLDQYWIWLSSVRGMTHRRFFMLLKQFETPRNVWENPKDAKTILDPDTYAALIDARSEERFYRLFYDLEKSDAVALPSCSSKYPKALLEIEDYPTTLYVRGNPDLDYERVYAIVGTRRPTYDGRKAAGEFSSAFAKNDVCVVSGLARGIDTCAHKGCLDAGGRTIAVLGSGLNVIYPPENADLAKRIIDSGGSVISEMQLNDEPQKWSFPARNRIISGLSKGVLVIEGRKTSGGLITAERADEQSRDVFTLPGSIYSPMSEGTNILMQLGANIALSPWDIIEHSGWGERPQTASEKKAAANLNPEQQKIVDCIANEPFSFDEIAQKTGFSAAALNSHLTMLILRGIILKTPGNYYRTR